jgi:hypothetical protein
MPRKGIAIVRLNQFVCHDFYFPSIPSCLIAQGTDLSGYSREAWAIAGEAKAISSRKFMYRNIFLIQGARLAQDAQQMIDFYTGKNRGELSLG